MDKYLVIHGIPSHKCLTPDRKEFAPGSIVRCFECQKYSRLTECEWKIMNPFQVFLYRIIGKIK